MSILTREEAQERADQIVAFQKELDCLQQEGAWDIPADQRQCVEDHHRSLLAEYARRFDIDQGDHASQLSLGMRIASLFGALAISASVYFLFYQFWGWLSSGVQVAVLISAPLLFMGVTVWVRQRDASGYFAKLAGLVTFVCFVLDVSMLGQIFNIAPSDSALLVWGGLAFLLAYGCGIRLLLVAGILCVVAYVGARTGEWSGMYWLDFSERPENFFPAVVLLLAAPRFIDHRRFPDFVSMYHVFGLLAFFLPVLVLSHLGGLSYLDWNESLIEGSYQVVGFAGAALAVVVGVRGRLAEIVNVGVAFFVIFFYTKLFDWWWDVMPKYLFFLVLGLVALLLLLVFKRLRLMSFANGKGQS